MRKILVTALVSAFALVSQVNAQIRPSDPPIEPPTKDGTGKPWTAAQVEYARESGNLFKPATELYRASEFSFDVYSAYTAPDIESIKDGDIGFGIGANYFFTRNFGLGFEASHSFEKDEDFLNQISLNAQVRFPFGRVAPYAFAGGGYRWQHHDLDWRLYAGAGVEFRLNGNVGLFTDVRAVTDTKFESVLQYVGRAGIRLSF